MTKKISTFAIMLGLASSLAVAGSEAKSPSSDDANPKTAAASDGAAQKDNDPCGSAKDTKRPKRKAKPAPTNQPTNQEEEFDRVLRGIYG